MEGVFRWDEVTLVKVPAPPKPLRRGFWYRVTMHTNDGNVRVANRAGDEWPLHESQIYVVDIQPSTITRIAEPGFGYEGVCPEGHLIRSVAPVPHLECAACGITYAVEEEHRLTFT